MYCDRNSSDSWEPEGGIFLSNAFATKRPESNQQIFFLLFSSRIVLFFYFIKISSYSKQPRKRRFSRKKKRKSESVWRLHWVVEIFNWVIHFTRDFQPPKSLSTDPWQKFCSLFCFKIQASAELGLRFPSVLI